MRAWARDHLTDGWVNKPLKFRLVCREFSEFPGELVFTRLSGRLGIVGKYNAYFHGWYVLWWENGNIHHVKKMVFNRPDGPEYVWNEAGVLIRRRVWNLGRPIHRMYTWHAEGLPRSIISYSTHAIEVEYSRAGRLSRITVRDKDNIEVFEYNYCQLHTDAEPPHLIEESHTKNQQHHGPRRQYICSMRVPGDVYVAGKRLKVPPQPSREFELAHTDRAAVWEEMQMIPESEYPPIVDPAQLV